MKITWIGTLVLAASAVAAAQEDHGPFLKSFEEGFAKARAEQKLLFVDFSHPW